MGDMGNMQSDPVFSPPHPASQVVLYVRVSELFMLQIVNDTAKAVRYKVGVVDHNTWGMQKSCSLVLWFAEPTIHMGQNLYRFPACPSNSAANDSLVLEPDRVKNSTNIPGDYVEKHILRKMKYIWFTY
jgi:hypothetical protein